MRRCGTILRAGCRRSSLAVLTVWLAAAASLALADTDAQTVVVAREFMFAPVTLTVKAGSTVTWTNKDDEPHTVASDTGLFRSGALDTNDTFVFRFDKPGTYHYTCTIHPRMVGTVVVQ